MRTAQDQRDVFNQQRAAKLTSLIAVMQRGNLATPDAHLLQNQFYSCSPCRHPYCKSPLLSLHQSVGCWMAFSGVKINTTKRTWWTPQASLAKPAVTFLIKHNFCGEFQFWKLYPNSDPSWFHKWNPGIRLQHVKTIRTNVRQNRRSMET